MGCCLLNRTPAFIFLKAFHKTVSLSVISRLLYLAKSLSSSYLSGAAVS